MARINTTDGSILSSSSCTSLVLNDQLYQTSISCSSNTETICYTILRNASVTGDYLATQIDFNNTSEIKYADPSGSTTYLSSIVAVDDNHVIMGGIDIGATPHKYFFAKFNFSVSLPTWKVESNAIEDVYNQSFTRAVFSFLNDDSDRLINIMQIELLPIVIVLNPADGTLIDAKKIDYNLTYDSGRLQASGKFSNNTAMITFTGFAPDVNPLIFINTDTWVQTSYIPKVFIVINGFTPLFNTDQIIMLVRTNTFKYLTLQAAYDKLNATEFFNAATYNLTDINDTLGFNTSSTATFSQRNHTLASFTPTVSDPMFDTDSSKTYEVTANIISSNVATFEGSTKSSSLGPVEFSCYSVTTSASSANFSNQLSMTQSDGQAIPSWMSIDSSTSTISLSSAEVSSGDYIVINSLTGVENNFTFDSNVTINIVLADSDEDYCLGASNQGLCGFFVTIIIFGVLIPVILIALVIYFKFKPEKGSNDMTKLDQEQPDEGNQDNNNVENDESVQMNQHRMELQNVENGTIQHAEDDGQDNQV